MAKAKIVMADYDPSQSVQGGACGGGASGAEEIIAELSVLELNIAEGSDELEAML